MIDFALIKVKRIEEDGFGTDYEVKPGSTILEFLRKEYPNGFGAPTSYFLNGKELDPFLLDTKLKASDIVICITRTEGFTPLISFFTNILINIAISYILSKLFSAPESDGPVDENYESVYSTNVSQIQAKKNGTIPSLYGVTRVYPSLITETFKRYENNIEVIYLTTCVGVGSYDIIQCYLDDNKVEEITNKSSGEAFSDVSSYDKTPTYGPYFDNNTLGQKNEYLSDVISYKILTSSYDLENPGLAGRSFFRDNNYRHIVRTLTEVSNIPLNDSYQTIGWYTINEEDDIDKVEVDVVFQGGLYVSESTDEGDPYFDTATQGITIQVIGYDAFGVATYRQSQYYEFSGNSKKVLRYSIGIDVPSGKYKIKIIRGTESSANNPKVSNNPTIEAIKGYYTETPMKYSNMSLAVFRIISNQDLSEGSARKFNLITRRKNTTNYSMGNYMLTLRDFIEDIWTNEVYGLGEDLAKLDIRVPLDENCNIILDTSANAFTTLSDVLKGYGYMFYPTGSQFVIDRDTFRDITSYIFNENNSKDLSINWNIPQKEELGDGVLVKYLKQGELNFSEILYPPQSDYPTEYTLKGIVSEEQALNAAFRFYQKQNIRGRSAELTTELEGYIPELNSKVGVSQTFLSDTNTVEVNGIIINPEDSTTLVTLAQPIKTEDKIKSCLICYKNGEFSNRMECQPTEFDENGMAHKILIMSFVPDSDIAISITIGDETSMLEYFLLESISPTVSEDGSTEIKLKLIEYNSEVYDAPNA